MHTTEAVVKNSEPRCMPITIGDFFEDEVTAGSIQLEDSVEVDSIMNIMTAMLGSKVEWTEAGQAPFLTMWMLSLLCLEWTAAKLLSIPAIAAIAISLFF